MKKVLFVATVVKTHIMEFHIPYLKMFKDMGWETAVAAKNDYDNPADCIIPYCDKYYDISFGRNPFTISNFKAYKELKRVIDEGDYEIIHCHTPVGGALTRIAAMYARKKGARVYYTAHGFHFYDGAPLINWLLYYPIERILSKFTDVLITINKEDFRRAKSFSVKELYYVPGVGVDLKKFNRVFIDKKLKRQEIGVKSESFVLLSVGELVPRNNHEVVIRALADLKLKGQLDSIEYVICGCGVLETKLKNLAIELEVSGNVHFIGYRNDISEIYNCCDLFMLMSHQDRFPIALIEAMACGLAVICSNIRGNMDLIDDGSSGLIVENCPTKLSKSILELKNNHELRETITYAALEKIKHFDLGCVEEITERINDRVNDNSLYDLYMGQKIRKEFGIPINADVILSVGEVNKNKNHKLGIEALSKLSRRNIYYVVCGRGPLTEYNIELAKQLGVNDRVIFAGYRNDVRSFYKMADYFLFPSLREGLSLALMEAIACGLPIICSSIRGNTDLVENDVTGLVTHNKSKEIVDYLLKLESNSFQKYSFVKAGFKKIKDFDLHTVLQKMKHIYKI